MNNFTPPPSPIDGAVNLTASTANRKRITWLDSLKGFAIICVVIGHVVLGLKNAGLYPSFKWAEVVIAEMVYAFHMPLFFLISGFLFSRAYTSPEGSVKFGKLKTQLLDITAVYVIFSFLTVCFYALFSRYANFYFSFTDLLFIWYKPIFVYWYLYVLFFLYLVNAALVKFKCVTLLSTSFFILGVIVASLPTFPGTESIRNFFFFLPFFYLGTAIQRHGRMPNWGVAVIGLVFACTLHLVAKVYGSHCGVIFASFAKSAIALGLSIFFLKAFSVAKWLDNKLLTVCGRYCLEIYVTHNFLTAGLRSVFMVLGVSNFWLSLVLNTILSTAIPILFAMWLERLGVHDILFRPAHWLRRIRKVRQQ